MMRILIAFFLFKLIDWETVEVYLKRHSGYESNYQLRGINFATILDDLGFSLF